MGFDYAFVHVKYTIPPAILLSLLYRPLANSIDVYKIAFLIIIAVVSTIPWDSYLIRQKIWSYPPEVVAGPCLFDIPAEEVFFFVIQTYNTSLLYLLLSKPTFHAAFLRAEKAPGSNKILHRIRFAGQVSLVLSLISAWFLVQSNGSGTYLGLIVGWAFPFLLLLWSLAYQFLIELPWTNTVLPIALPTAYLWIVDTIALRRGTWVIENGTKLGLHLWPGLEIEEAIFFLVTNCLIVFGLVAFDNALAVLYTLTPVSQRIPELPSPLALINALLVPASMYDSARIQGLLDAIGRLRSKSRSFYLASGVFQGKLRVDLILLYSFCRVADDLVDNAASGDEARDWISKLKMYLDLAYDKEQSRGSLTSFVNSNFPTPDRSALLLLPTWFLSRTPLNELLEGFEMDLVFDHGKSGQKFPIETEADLELYSARVAGTVAHLCLDLVFAHVPHNISDSDRESLTRAGVNMGIALQLVNIARDIEVDAMMNRVYLPTTWLNEASLTPEAVMKQPRGSGIKHLKRMLLSKAFMIYDESKDAINGLPQQVRGPMRVAVESYMEIGRVLKESSVESMLVRGRATVPSWRRILVAWQALSGKT